MKKIIFILTILAANYSAFACPVCERNKPAILKGITHGTNPDSNWDYLIVGVMLLITVFSLYYSIKWLIKPNENDRNHIKYSFLNK